MISPTNCTFSFFENTTIATPINAINGANAPTSKAINCPVIVVPILAPMMIHTAWFNVIIPEFTNPTTITVVAEDDWITAVIKAPTIIPKNLLDVNFSKMSFILFPATDSNPLLIICIP